MPLIDTIRANWEAAVRNRCRESGCALTMGGVPRHVILKGEELVDEGKACDCVIIIVDAQRVVVALVELKSGSLDPDDIGKQLAGGWDGCRRVLQESSVREEDCDVFPILLAKSYSGRTELRKLMGARVHVCGCALPITRGKCGEDLMSLIAKSTRAPQ